MWGDVLFGRGYQRTLEHRGCPGCTCDDIWSQRLIDGLHERDRGRLREWVIGIHHHRGRGGPGLISPRPLHPIPTHRRQQLSWKQIATSKYKTGTYEMCPWATDHLFKPKNTNLQGCPAACRWGSTGPRLRPMRCPHGWSPSPPITAVTSPAAALKPPHTGGLWVVLHLLFWPIPKQWMRFRT